MYITKKLNSVIEHARLTMCVHKYCYMSSTCLSQFIWTIMFFFVGAFADTSSGEEGSWGDELPGAEKLTVPAVRNIDPSIPRSSKPCMIMFTKGENVMMPCGHIISPKGLREYSWKEICVNRKTNVCCLVCSKEWDMSTIRLYGGATSKEIQRLQKCIYVNTGIFECPRCSSHCERMSKSNGCVTCYTCSLRRTGYFYFCMNCEKEWIGSPSNQNCGNDKCIKAEDFF